MCLQDYAIGMGLFCGEKIVQVGVTSQAVVGANPNRTLLVFAHPTANVVYLSTVNPATANQGFHLGSGDQPIFLHVLHHGNLPSMAWFGIAVGGTAPMSIFEGEFNLDQIKQFLAKIKA